MALPLPTNGITMIYEADGSFVISSERRECADDPAWITTGEALTRAEAQLGVKLGASTVRGWRRIGVVAPVIGRNRHAKCRAECVDEIVRAYRARAIQVLSLPDLIEWLDDNGVCLSSTVPRSVPDMTTATKVCKACGEMLNTSYFSRQTAAADGLAYYCKVCAADKLREWRRRPPPTEEPPPPPKHCQCGERIALNRVTCGARACLRISRGGQPAKPCRCGKMRMARRVTCGARACLRISRGGK